MTPSFYTEKKTVTRLSLYFLVTTQGEGRKKPFEKCTFDNDSEHNVQ